MHETAMHWPLRMDCLWKEWMWQMADRSLWQYHSKGWRFGGELDILPDKEMPASQIIERCLSMMLNEAVLCLEDGTIACPRDGDIAAIFGIGFPPFFGGPFRYMDKRGLSTMVANLHRLQKQHGDQYAPAGLLVEKADNNEAFYDDA